MQEKTLLEEIQDDYNHPKKKKREKKIEKKGLGFLTKLKIGLLVLITLVGLAYWSAESYHNWRAENQPQFPYQWIGWVRKIETATNTVANAQTKEPMTDQQIIEQYHLSPVIKTVYFLESTSGKNDGCKDEGKINGYGFRQNGSEWKCYDSFEEVTEEVNEWFEEVLSVNGNDLVDAVCYYNKGIHGLTSCGDYSANFFSVLTKNF